MRKTCPRGHRTWRNQMDGYYCPRCEAHFDYLLDLKHEDPDPGHTYDDGGSR